MSIEQQTQSESLKEVEDSKLYIEVVLQLANRPQGVTRLEAANHVHTHQNAVCWAFSELIKRGQLQAQGTRVSAETGRKQTFYKIGSQAITPPKKSRKQLITENKKLMEAVAKLTTHLNQLMERVRR